MRQCTLRNATFRAAALLVTATALPAAELTLDILNADRFSTPGATETFSGTITNNTDRPLASTELFLNFSGFDPVNVNLDQLLGLTAFSIPVDGTSASVPLFTFQLGSGASVPGVFPAVVLLQASGGELADPVTAVVRTAVPEPGGWTLVCLGLAILGVLRRKARRTLVAGVLTGAVLLPAVGSAQVQFASGSPGVATIDGNFQVALPVRNQGSTTATNVRVTSISLQTAPLVSPTTFPVMLGTMAAEDSRTIEAGFAAAALSTGTPYLMTVRGTYEVGSTTFGFAVNRFVGVPVSAPGSSILGTATVGSNTVTGAPYPPQPVSLPEDVNEAGPPIPTGPFISGVPTPSTTGVQQAPVISGQQSQGFQAAAGTVTFRLNNSTGVTGGISSVAEPSGSSSGQIVFATANWRAIYSTNSGSTFTSVNPTTVFPNDAVGYCCDQVVQYVPSVDRFVWVLQGNGYRVAVARPIDIQNSGATAWTYWNLTPQVFGHPNGTGLDYPSVSVGNSFLYISWDVGFGGCPPGCASGYQVARIPLSQLQAGGTINIGFTNPANGARPWGSHVTQNTGDEVFWAGHNGTSQLQVFSLAENSNTYFWRFVDISSWPNNALSSLTPDSQNWLAFGFPGNSIIGAVRQGNRIWFGWNVGTNNFFQQPHVELVVLDRANNFNKVEQHQIWNNSYAFAYPALSLNSCTGEIGLSLEYGGGGNYENHVVGFWGDFIVYVTTNSNVGSTRFGDYVTIRQNPGFFGEYFDAFGYGVRSSGGGTQSDAHYVVFGRGGACTIG